MGERASPSATLLAQSPAGHGSSTEGAAEACTREKALKEGTVSTKFFTNDEANTLLNKFAGIFAHNPDIEFQEGACGSMGR